MIKEKLCQCGQLFTYYENPSSLKKGAGTYCSKTCLYKYRKRPTGLKYKIKTENKGWFKNGISSWLLGKKGIHQSPLTEFKKGEHLEEKHWQWKGDGVGKDALHFWIKRRLVKPSNCDICGKEKILDLANKSGKYIRSLDDWLWLCKKCHYWFDRKGGRKSAT